MTPNSMATVRATGVVTNGEGRVSLDHLNTTRTMADVWRADLLKSARLEKDKVRRRAKRESHSTKARYAGLPA